MLILYLVVLISGLYFVSKILLPEMARPPLTKTAGEGTDISQVNDSENRINKLEILLAEKNKNIGLLQNELKVFQVQVHDFDKIKSLLEEEIRQLREQNRIFRSELGLPAVQVKEVSIA